MTLSADLFRCPRCLGDIVAGGDAYHCLPCATAYPVLCGIPDFRLRSDRYLSLDDERAKAARLDSFAHDHSFAELVAEYYRITDDVPPDLAVRYARYVDEAAARARDILAGDAPLGDGDRVLDLGCGSGGMVVACAERGIAVVGADIALRWLVICRKRLETLGLDATLVCADAAALPFAPAGFSRLFAVDLVENVDAPAAVMTEAARQLAPAGTIWVSASNRLWLGPHPSVGVWAVGLLPRRLRSEILVRLRGVDSLRNVNLLSPLIVARACRAAGLDAVTARARGLGRAQLSGRGEGLRWLASIYGRLRNTRGLRGLMAMVGPAFETTARRRSTTGAT